MWRFIEDREAQYEKYFDKDMLFDKPLSHHIFSQDLRDTLTYNFFISPGKLNVNEMDIMKSKLFFDDWMPIYSLTMVDIEHALTPYMDFTMKRVRP